VVAEGFSFSVREGAEGSSARLGTLRTPHGRVETPVFMPVGTQGAVKGLLPGQVREAGLGLILANTYHLALRPGTGIVGRHGGLHDFMGWDGAILSDSGGFQVYSLARLREVGERGVVFRSHIDGSLHEFTPEGVMGMQEELGSDIAMVLDVCPPSTAARQDLENALDLTSDWARRSIEARTRADQAVFGIVQGGLDMELRTQHARVIASLPFEGIAIGGLSVGEPPSKMYPVVEATACLLPRDRPRYLMGVGMPVDLVRCVMAGIDMFDCVYPTRAARNGLLLTSRGRLVIKHARYREDLEPPDPDCECPTCQSCSRAYLRHLYKGNEILSSVLNTIHNLHYYSRLMKDIRAAASEGTLDELAERVEAAYPPD